MKPGTRDGFPATGVVATGLMGLAFVASFCLSAMTLAAIGVKYEADGGPALLKIHPANWAFLAAIVANVLAQSRPLAYMRQWPRAFPGTVLFLAMAAVTLLFATQVQHAPFSPVVDTYFAGVAMLVLYEGVPERSRKTFRLTLHIILFLNASIGVGEFFTHLRLTPFLVAGVPLLHDNRSTALFGHPLLNAGTTAAYVIALFLGADRAIGGWLRLGLMAVQAAALIAFGGRTALVLTAIIVGVGLLPRIAGVLNGRRFDKTAGLAIALGAPLLAATLAYAASKGLFAELLDRFADDKGSTQARVVIFDLFGAFSLEDLLLGPDPQRLASLQRTLGIEYGIENSWLGLLFQYGALITAFFVTGLLALFADIAARSRRNVIVLIVYFLILVSAAASLSVKSFAFNQFALILLILFDKPATSTRSPARAAASERVAGEPAVA